MKKSGKKLLFGVTIFFLKHDSWKSKLNDYTVRVELCHIQTSQKTWPNLVIPTTWWKNYFRLQDQPGLLKIFQCHC